MPGSSKTLKALGPDLFAMFFGTAYLLILPRFVAGAETRVRSLPALTAAGVAASSPGSQVLVQGSISQQNETRYRSFEADFVAGGTRREYIFERMSQRWGYYLTGVCSLVCGLVLFAGAIVVWRASRRSRPASASS